MRPDTTRHCCRLCAVVAAAHRGNPTELREARHAALDAGIGEEDVDEATWEGLGRAEDPAYPTPPI